MRAAMRPTPGEPGRRLRPLALLLSLSLLPGCDDIPGAPFPWTYVGPPGRLDLTARFVARLKRDCPRLVEDRSGMGNFDVRWTRVPNGRNSRNAIRVTAGLRADYAPRDPGSPVKAGDEVNLLMVGGAEPGYLLVGIPAHWECAAKPPPGPAPTSLKPQRRLARVDHPD